METQTESTNVTIENQDVEQVNYEAVNCPDCDLSVSTTETLKQETTGYNKNSVILLLIGIIIIICFFIAISFYSTYNAAKTLNSEIEAITTVSASDGTKLGELQYRYNNMSDFQKKYVTSYDTLVKAKSIQKALEVGDEIIKIKNRISAGEITSDLGIEGLTNFKSSVETAKQEYDSLSEFQKEQLSEEAINEAKTFDNIINSLNEMIDLEKQRNSNLQSQNTYSSNNSIKSGITLEKYEKIQNGMTYSQAVSILGTEGTLISSMDIAGIKQYTYGWYGEYGVPMIGIVIQNGQIVSKLQVGLQ